jgi:glutathione S-transferase
MITLYQPPRAWGLPNPSPFCVKLETYLRMAGIPYEVKQGSMARAPKGRIPYVKLGGQLLGDSALIIERLKQEHGDPLDARLTPEQRALAVAAQRLIEDHLYFAGAWLRWTSDAGWPYLCQAFRPMLPPLIGGAIMKRIRKAFIRHLQAHGMGQHSHAEILAFACQDITALSTLLGDRPFFLGDEPTTIDASLYGFLIQQMEVPWESELKRHARGHANLVAYVERMRLRYWKDA